MMNGMHGMNGMHATGARIFTALMTAGQIPKVAAIKAARAGALHSTWSWINQ
jgi:hypothetical protein